MTISNTVVGCLFDEYDKNTVNRKEIEIMIGFKGLWVSLTGSCKSINKPILV